jgi:tetratricopeptide (TPR) repeat protein
MRWLVPILFLFSATAWAGDLIEKAEDFRLNKADCNNAIKLADRVLRSPDSEPEDLAAAYRIKGLCLAASGSNEKATEAFSRLLAIDKDFELTIEVAPDLSPKLEGPFIRAKADSKRREPITLSHKPPKLRAGRALGGAELEVKLMYDPLAMAKGIRLRYWSAGENMVKTMYMKIQGPGTVSLNLPMKLKALEVKYYFEATNAHKGVLARAGTKDKPFSLKTVSDEQSVVLLHKPPDLKPGQVLAGLRLKATVKDPLGKVEYLQVIYWPGIYNIEDKPIVNAEGLDEVTIRLPEDYHQDEISYYLRALDEYEGVLTTAGTKEDPFHLRVSEHPVVLRHRQPQKSLETLANLELKVELASDPLEQVKWINLRYLTSDDNEEKVITAPARGPGIVKIKLPFDLEANEIKYYIVATDMNDVVHATKRTAEDPYLLYVGRKPSTDQILEPESATTVGKRLDPEKARIEVEFHGCLGGSEFVGDQGGSAGDGSDPDSNSIVLNKDPSVRARMGTGRWGGGTKMGARFGRQHLLYAQFDFFREQWLGYVGEAQSVKWDASFSVLRLAIGYRFAYPATDWMEPFAEAAVGGHFYLPRTMRLLDDESSDVITKSDLKPDHRFALLLGVGIRFVFLQRMFASTSYLLDVPFYEVTSSSFVIGAGSFF